MVEEPASPPLKGKIILPGSPEAPTIFLPKEVAERLQNLRPGQKRPYERRSVSSGLDFDRQRAAVAKRRRRMLKRLGRQL